MFGHQDHKSSKTHHKSQQQDTNDVPTEPIQLEPPTEPTEFGAGDNHDSATETASSEPAGNQSGKHPGTPVESDSGQIKDVISPAGGYPRSTSSQLPTTDDSNDSNAVASDNVADIVGSSAHELIDIKQKALSELSPLIDQLDQSPEEKFRTIMMMIQASDDQTLVKAAYKAAHAIKNEKTHAQALLDIVNEINYFTQQPEK